MLYFIQYFGKKIDFFNKYTENGGSTVINVFIIQMKGTGKETAK